MERTLGIDLGTNSIGWAIVDCNNQQYQLYDKGVHIFQEGVAREKGNEIPAVKTRTAARAMRKLYARRRIRKIELLQILIDNNLCPYLSKEELDLWKSKKVYPLNDDFIGWQRTNDEKDDNPYHDRYICLTESLNLNEISNRYVLGRALYHLCQRRGFLSNRKDSTKESDGAIKTGITSLTQEIERANCEYLGEYYYKLYKEHKKIRGHYSSRNEHYVKEFNAICQKQQLPPELTKALYDAIFYQRPLKSQKGLIGHCTFEKKKTRCPISHPAFEEFRMLSFINNIKIKTYVDEDFRQLTAEEVNKITPLFYRKSKANFDFLDIAKKLAGNASYACKKSDIEAEYFFNYSEKTNVTGCPFTAQLMDIFGGKNKEEYLDTICSLYQRTHNKIGEKTPSQILNDIWHVLYSFSDEENLIEWSTENLQLSTEDAIKFSKIKVKQDYAALSLNAINKILPYLRKGLRYDEAVFLGNLKQVLGQERYDTEGQEIAKQLLILLRNNRQIGIKSGITSISDFLQHNYNIDEKHLKKLYHPSMIEVYKPAIANNDGILQLGSPRISSVRNPMAMRSLFRLRHLINSLLLQGEITPETKINIEFARELNDANMRKAIQALQRENEKKRDHARAEIIKMKKCSAEEVSDNDILKYLLWEEQNHICLYTGKTISFNDFLGADPKFDIEHTIARSIGGDNSMENKTLCDRTFNREIKGKELPSSLSNASEIMTRIKSLNWYEEIDKCEIQYVIAKRKASEALSKEKKDEEIQRMHIAKMKKSYWHNKIERFKMPDVPEGFSNRQGVDIGIIGRYARLYLKTIFPNIYTVKGSTTSEFRQLWGLQSKNSAKNRDNHIHHCIDAVTIACIDKNTYDKWAQYKVDEENYLSGKSKRPYFQKPWETFTEDVLSLKDEVLISHYTANNTLKQTKKKVRINGKPLLNSKGEFVYAQGNTIRGALCKDSFYGAIKKEDEIKYVIRKSLSLLNNKDEIKKIVDDVVRQKVQDFVDLNGFDSLKDASCNIWMNEEKQIPIKKVRVYTPTITNPINLKSHRDCSRFNHKQDYHVDNEENYCMALYEWTNEKGKTKRELSLFSLYQTIKNKKGINNQTVIPLSNEKGDLRCILKKGTMVLLYEKSPQEIFDCNTRELTKRLYKVTGFSKNPNRITLQFHQDAGVKDKTKNKKEKNVQNGKYHNGEETRPIIVFTTTTFNGLVEGYDFYHDITGKIRFK